MSKTDYTLWPNAGGTLGQIKVEIPTGTADDPWPTGDALVDNFIYKDGKLAGFVDNKALINNNSKISNIPYDYVRLHLENIGEGDMTFTLGERCKKFNVTYGSASDTGNSGDTVVTLKYKGCTTVDEIKAVDSDYLANDIVDGAWTEGLGDLEDGNSMFYDCLTLKTFESDLSSLTNGEVMFYSSNISEFTSNLSSLQIGTDMFDCCSELTSFNSDLSSLTDGTRMFCGCNKLTSFNSDLSSLTDGNGMFWDCNNFSEFSSDLSKMTNGRHMFSGCSNLTTFSSDLSSLTDGQHMFYDCYDLTSFSSDLSSLTNGYDMFRSCKLDTASVQNIADTINTPTSKGTIHIYIGNSSPNEQEETAFNTIASKNWTVYVNGSWNGSQWTPTATTPIDGEQTVTPIPFWAKPVQSDEQHAHYVDSEGNYYNILGGNFIYGDSLETYGMFVSEEDAAANMRLTRIGEKEIETI